MVLFEKGFTLIELMIVVAILGVLAAVSIPRYQDYVIRSQLSRAVGELASYKSVIEERISSSSTISNSDIGYRPSNLTDGSGSAGIANIGADGSGHIEVTMGGVAHPKLTGVIIRLERNSKGAWGCLIDSAAVAATWKSDYLPVGCRS